MSVIKFVYKNLDHFKRKFLLIFSVGILSGLVSFLIPAMLAEFTKSAFSSTNFQRLIQFIIGLYTASLFLQWIIRKWGEALGPQFANHIRSKYFKSLEKMAVRDLTNVHSGYILSLVNKIADALNDIFFYIVWSFSGMIASMSLFFYFTARESFNIAFFNLAILIIFVTISTYLSRKMVPIADELNKKHASLLESYADFMANILTVKRLGIYSFADKKLFGKTADNDYQTRKLQRFHANRWAFLHTLYGAAFISTIGFLLFQISRDIISPAVLILFVAAYTIVRGNIEQLSESLKNMMQIKAYLASLDKIITPDVQMINGTETKSWDRINLRDVSLQYLGTEKKITIPNFEITKGEKICIIGKSGEGKTTFLNLFANFLKPDSGGCFIDGKPYEEIGALFFTRNMAMISQETELFNISLRENITLGQDIDDKIIIDILERIDLLAWVKSLDDGLGTIVGEKGVKLSAGQKQRVNLVRGILLDRQILLLDEPTSHLDAATEVRVIDFLREYLLNKTAIIVSHREPLKTLCDRRYGIEHHSLIKV